MSDSARSQLLEEALRAASDTRQLHMRPGALADIAAMFREQFGGASAVVIADPTTFEVAGRQALDQLRSGRVPVEQPVVITDPALYAEWRFVETLDATLASTASIPVAVGSGTINDLVKLAAHRAGRPYMAVPTAASMDGYTAFGASITTDGSKQTFSCPAPRAVVADLNVVATAPAAMTASGYADLMAKVTAGADWIVADALDLDPIDPFSWKLVQEPLHGWLGNPDAVRAGDPAALGRLMEGLMMGGFAMQHLQSSRPASGAEHQFSHLWDMQHHIHDGKAPSHGFKVGIGTLASADLYEALFDMDLHRIDADALAAQHPSVQQIENDIRHQFSEGDLAAKAIEESRAKHIDAAQLKLLLRKLSTCWPELRRRLQAHLMPRAEIAQRLSAVGAPARSEQIGISSDRLRASYWQAYYIRRRFTVLDLALRAGVLDSALDRIFASQPSHPAPQMAR